MSRGFVVVAGVLVLLAGGGSDSVATSAKVTSDIYSIALDGSNQRNLTNTPDVAEDLLSRSPDGTKLAFVHGEWLVVAGTEGEGLRRVATFSRDDNFMSPPRWSPNGRTLAYVQGFSCTGVLCYRQELWVADVETGTARRLRQGVVEPAWSPDGTRFAYVRARLTTQGREPGYRQSVVVARTDGTHRRTIAANASSPTWSPSGRFLAFNGPKLGNLIRSRPDGSGRVSLLPRPRHRDWIGDVDHIAWSPGPRRIAFTGFSLNAGDAVYVIRGNGRGLRRLGPVDSHDAPSWAPDGKKIVWPHPTRRSLLVASVDGRSRRELPVLIATMDVKSAVWSADGSRIFFTG